MASFYIEQIAEDDLLITAEQIKLIDTIGQGIITESIAIYNDLLVCH